MEFDPLERLTLLESSAIDWRNIPSDYQHLTASDIASRLAKIPLGASLIGRVKIVQQRGLYRHLIACLKQEILGSIIEHAKPVHEKMCETAILEVLDEKICSNCRGLGYVPEQIDGQLTGSAAICTAAGCKDGRTNWTEYARSKSIGVHHEVFRRRHSREYVEILTIPWTWEGQVREALKN